MTLINFSQCLRRSCVPHRRVRSIPRITGQPIHRIRHVSLDSGRANELVYCLLRARCSKSVYGHWTKTEEVGGNAGAADQTGSEIRS